MRDIARDLNVSVITVSKVLRNHPDIGLATRNRVLQRVRELNYRPNPAARSLATQRSFMIGVVVPDLIISFFAELILSISKRLRARGYEVVVANSEENARLEIDEVEHLVGRRVDGLIIASSQPAIDPAFFRGLAARKIPFVLVDRNFPDLAASFVGCDNERIGEIATAHLVQAGCSR